jgi:hypothetical protein
MKVFSKKLKNEENNERSRGENVRFDLPPVRPNDFLGLALAS